MNTVFRTIFAGLLLIGVGVQSAMAVVLRDDFNASFDYSGGAVSGTGIWTGSYNAGNGGSTFDANTTAPGGLTMGSDNVGWEGNGRDDARFLYRSVPADELREVRVKITGQTRIRYNMAGLMVRQPSPLDDTASNDNFVTMGAMDTDTDFWGGTGTTVIAQNVVGGGETELVNQDGLTIADVGYLRLVHWGIGDFEVFSSTNGVDWTSRWTMSNGALASGNLEVGLWAGSFEDHVIGGEVVNATATFDWVEIETGLDAAEPFLEWSVDGNGDWNRGNWGVMGGKPDSNISVAMLGAALTQPTGVVYTNQTVKLKELQFNNVNKYIVAGAGAINLDADTGNAAITVVQGTHEIQASLILSDNTVATAQAGSVLNINAPIYLNGKTFTTSGTVNLNHGTIFGSVGGGGALVNEGELSGLGAVGGDFEQTGGGSLSLLVGASPIEVAGEATLAGLLDVALAEGFTPEAGSLYPVLTAGSVTDAGLTLSGAGAKFFELVVGADSVSLLATAVPEPGTLAIVVVGMAMCAGARRRRSVSVSARVAPLIVALVLGSNSAAVAQFGTFRDDFGNDATPNGGTFNYAAGTVPSGGIWSGVHNATNGGNQDFPAFFVADGFDFDGNSKAGKLFIEDLGVHVNTDGSTGVGWEAGRNNAPFLYRTVPADANFTATMKIDAQTSDTYSYVPIITRLAGAENPVGLGFGDTIGATESYITSGPMRYQSGSPDNGFVLTQSVLNTVESEVTSPWFSTPFPIWVKVEKSAGLFTTYTSFDGTNFTQQTQFSNPALNTAGKSLEVGPAFMMYTNTFGSADIDFFEITVEAPGTLLSSQWAPRSSQGNSGNWLDPLNWSSNVPGYYPNTNTVDVTLGGSINGPATVIVNEGVTVRSLKFESPNKYAVSGSGGITFQPDPINQPGTPDITVVQGKHDIQVAVALGTNNTDLTAAAGTEINFNNTLNLNSRQLIVSGPGRANFNNNIDTGTAGSVVSTGNVGGSGRINGNLQNNGGVVNPGNGVGTLTVDALFSQNASGTLNIELGGTGAGQYDRLAVGTSAVLNGFVSASYVNGFVPAIGDVFTILTASTVNNAGIIELAPQDVPYYQLIVNANNVQLKVLAVESTGGLIGDYNGDNKVDAGDYTVWRDKLGTSATLANRDPANTGNISPADYNSWKARFGQMAGAGSFGAASVPEPSSILLLAGGLLLAVAPRRCGRSTC